MRAKSWSATLFFALLASCASPAPEAPAAATSAPSHIRPPNEDPAVEVVLTAVPSLVRPGEIPALTATIRNHGPVALWVSADDGPAPAVRLTNLVWHAGGAGAHRPIAMTPSRVLVPAGGSRRVHVRDPDDDGDDGFARWSTDPHELSVSYTTPASPTVATWSRTVSWELRDDGSAAAREGRFAQLSLSLSPRSRSSAEVQLSATNRELRSISIPQEVELSWWSGVERIAHERRALGALPRLGPYEVRQLPRFVVTVPEARGPLFLRATLTRPGEDAPVLEASAPLR